ncbi:hypothetical protein ACFWQC_25145 [Nocardioides sp. NPDC058538]|uniref:hypothetical protein n=1 Tax=Nocardioides sp. NPDC058538 TaxID=3346542 RepID=UPI003667B193
MIVAREAVEIDAQVRLQLLLEVGDLLRGTPIQLVDQAAWVKTTLIFCRIRGL